MSCQAAKGKLPKEERCKQNDNWSGAPEMSTLPLPIFWPGLGVNFHILLTQNWLWESSLSLLSLWCILFQIKLGLFRENLNLKKHLRPKNGWSTPSTFWHRLICEQVWPSYKALGWWAEGPQLDFTLALLSLQKRLWFVDTVLYLLSHFGGESVVILIGINFYIYI